jgi:[ribosomal protein S18]-alanine N-acetyltransferase
MARIRKAEPDDIPFMMDVERRSATAAHWNESQYRDLFRAPLDGGRGRLVLVAESSWPGSDAESQGKSTPIGFLIARHLAPEWELENIVVVTRARRSGVGESLLQALLRAARETHTTQVYLEVRESNSDARGLYEKLGFQPTGRRKAYYRDPAEDAVLYSLALGFKRH